MDIMLPPRRIVDLFVVVVPSSFVSECDSVSDMKMKPGHLSVRAYLFSWLRDMDSVSWLRDMDFFDGQI